MSSGASSAAAMHRGSYAEEFARNRGGGNTTKSLPKSEDLLDQDRAAYIAWLEAQLERFATAAASVLPLQQRLADQDAAIVELKSKVEGLTELITISHSYTEKQSSQVVSNQQTLATHEDILKQLATTFDETVGNADSAINRKIDQLGARVEAVERGAIQRLELEELSSAVSAFGVRLSQAEQLVRAAEGAAAKAQVDANKSADVAVSAEAAVIAAQERAASLTTDAQAAASSAREAIAASATSATHAAASAAAAQACANALAQHAIGIAALNQVAHGQQQQPAARRRPSLGATFTARPLQESTSSASNNQQASASASASSARPAGTGAPPSLRDILRGLEPSEAVPRQQPSLPITDSLSSLAIGDASGTTSTSPEALQSLATGIVTALSGQLSGVLVRLSQLEEGTLDWRVALQDASRRQASALAKASEELTASLDASGARIKADVTASLQSSLSAASASTSASLSDLRSQLGSLADSCRRDVASAEERCRAALGQARAELDKQLRGQAEALASLQSSLPTLERRAYEASAQAVTHLSASLQRERQKDREAADGAHAALAKEVALVASKMSALDKRVIEARAEAGVEAAALRTRLASETARLQGALLQQGQALERQLLHSAAGDGLSSSSSAPTSARLHQRRGSHASATARSGATLAASAGDDSASARDLYERWSSAQHHLSGLQAQVSELQGQIRQLLNASDYHHGEQQAERGARGEAEQHDDAAERRQLLKQRSAVSLQPANGSGARLLRAGYETQPLQQRGHQPPSYSPADHDDAALNKSSAPTSPSSSSSPDRPSANYAGGEGAGASPAAAAASASSPSAVRRETYRPRPLSGSGNSPGRPQLEDDSGQTALELLATSSPTASGGGRRDGSSRSRMIGGSSRSPSPLAMSPPPPSRAAAAAAALRGSSVGRSRGSPLIDRDREREHDVSSASGATSGTAAAWRRAAAAYL